MIPGEIAKPCVWVIYGYLGVVVVVVEQISFLDTTTTSKSNNHSTKFVRQAKRHHSYRSLSMNTKSLRHRNLDSPAGKDQSKDSSSSNSSSNKFNHMAYTRRSIATPFSRGGNNKGLPNSNKSLTSYRKKFFIILGVTSLYTAFLYRRGQ